MKIIITFIFFIILFVGLVRYIELTSVFYPDRTITATPKDIGLPFEDVLIKTQDHVNLHGWLIPSANAKSTLLFFHGNAGNISGRLGKIDLFHRMGINTLIIDYRGYGKSTGRATEKGIYEDALAAYDYLKNRPDMSGQNIIGYGASLGGAVAVDLAAKRSLSCLIIDSSFSSARDMAKWIYPVIPSFLIQTKMDSIRKIKNLKIPSLFIHSVDDQTVPFRLGKKLYNATPGNKVFIETVGGHNDGHLHDQEKVYNGLHAFLRKCDQI